MTKRLWSCMVIEDFFNKDKSYTLTGSPIENLVREETHRLYKSNKQMPRYFAKPLMIVHVIKWKEKLND